MNKALGYSGWVLLALLAALGFVWEFYPLEDASKRLQAFPRNGFYFAGYDVPVSQVENQVFKEAKLLKRVYSLGNQQFFLSAVDGTRNRGAVHDPTLCFRGSGYEVLERRQMPVPGGTAELLRMQNGEKSLEVLVWFSDGKRRFSSVINYWMATTLRRLSLGAYGAEPVRVIVQPIHGESLDWTALIRDFAPLWQL